MFELSMNIVNFNVYINIYKIVHKKYFKIIIQCYCYLSILMINLDIVIFQQLDTNFSIMQ